jgi:hypothetical protein
MEKTMETEFITGEHGELIKVIMDYPEYLKIAKQLNLPLGPPDMPKEHNPLDWYSLTESSNSIITGLIALTSREHLKELDKANPDKARLIELESLRDEVLVVYNKAENFNSLDRMEKIIEKYAPILMAEIKKVP